MLNAPTIASRITVERANFVICNECFWCASSLGAESTIERCPSCYKNAIEVMPVFHNERYAFDYNTSTGIILDFSLESKGKTRSSPASIGNGQRDE